NTVPTSGPLAANVKYFRFATAIRNTAVASIATDSIDKKYFVWLNDGGVATAPTVSGYQAIEVVYRSTATATATEPADTTVTLAEKIANAIALNVGSQATVTQASNVVSVSMTRAFDAENVADGATATGFGLQRVDGQVTTKVETTSTEYSGKLGNCLKGPATITQAKDNSGIPMTTLYDVSGSGKSGVYSADKSMALATRVNAVNSNFYTATDHTGGKPKGFITSAGVTPNEYYEFVCLDRAEEVIARIRVKVREWNTAKLFVNYRDASGTPSVSDVQSTDASNCSGTFATDASCVDNASLNDVKNDYKDWKDFVDAYPELRENI
ncbi:hypothetical protein EBZ37_05665, partial [bacterium]|nr:hypothetical protein [bacterium]